MCACVHLCLHTCACTCVCARLLSSPWGQAPSASLSSTAGFRLRFLPGGSPLSGQRALTSSSCWRLTGASSPEQCPHWPRGDPGPPLSLPQGQPALSAPALDPGVGHRPEGEGMQPRLDHTSPSPDLILLPCSHRPLLRALPQHTLIKEPCHLVCPRVGPPYSVIGGHPGCACELGCSVEGTLWALNPAHL